MSPRADCRHAAVHIRLPSPPVIGSRASLETSQNVRYLTIESLVRPGVWPRSPAWRGDRTDAGLRAQAGVCSAAAASRRGGLFDGPHAAAGANSSTRIRTGCPSIRKNSAFAWYSGTSTPAMPLTRITCLFEHFFKSSCTPGSPTSTGLASVVSVRVRLGPVTPRSGLWLLGTALAVEAVRSLRDDPQLLHRDRSATAEASAVPAGADPLKGRVDVMQRAACRRLQN